jgi:hypothetical protein
MTPVNQPGLKAMDADSIQVSHPREKTADNHHLTKKTMNRLQARSNAAMTSIRAQMLPPDVRPGWTADPD